MEFTDEGYYISVSSHEEFTKDDIVIDYQPEESTIKFAYTIIKDGIRSEPVLIEDNSIIRIVLKDSGQYKIEFTNYYTEDVKVFTTGTYNIDKTAPLIEFTEDTVNIKIGSDVNFTKYVIARDNADGDITEFVEIDTSNVDLQSIGKQKVIYRVKDEAGNESVKTLTINVTTYDEVQHTLKMGAFAGVILVILFVMLSYYRSINLERRISKFSVNPKAKKATLFERMIKVVTGMIEPFADLLSKSTILESYSTRFERYQVAFHEKSSMMIVAKKFIISILFFVISMIVVTLKLEVMTFFEMLLSLLIGFYIIDIVYLFKYHFYRKNVENDLLQAIIVMKNAFKAGNSLTQVIEIVAEELDGDIALEFRRMKFEISMGLSLEEVFERFSERLDLPEVSYLTSSLIILNQTGGNIMKVFSSIEKTLMNKKKIRLELRALTSGVKIVTAILIILPLAFMGIISLISPEYFAPFFDSGLGILLFSLIVAIYLLYISIVRKIMKVRV